MTKSEILIIIAFYYKIKKTIADQAKRIIELEQLVEKLMLRIAKLENSSKKSSKPQYLDLDIVKPPRPKLQDGELCKPGAQPGRKRNVRRSFENSYPVFITLLAADIKSQIMLTCLSSSRLLFIIHLQ